MDDPSIESQFRACSRNACKAPASVTLYCNYMARRVSLEDVQADLEPDHFHLCAEHLRRFRPPLGWQIEDVRTSAPLEMKSRSQRARATA